MSKKTSQQRKLDSVVALYELGLSANQLKEYTGIHNNGTIDSIIKEARSENPDLLSESRRFSNGLRSWASKNHIHHKQEVQRYVINPFINEIITSVDVRTLEPKYTEKIDGPTSLLQALVGGQRVPFSLLIDIGYTKEFGNKAREFLRNYLIHHPSPYAKDALKEEIKQYIASEAVADLLRKYKPTKPQYAALESAFNQVLSVPEKIAIRSRHRYLQTPQQLDRMDTVIRDAGITEQEIYDLAFKKLKESKFYTLLQNHMPVFVKELQKHFAPNGH